MYFIVFILFLLLVAILGTILYKYLRQEQDKIAPQNKHESALNVSESPKPLLLVIFGIACIHFMISLLMIKVLPFTPLNLMDSIVSIFSTILIMPSVILFMFTGGLLRSFEYSPTLGNIMDFLLIPVSSLFYGIFGGIFLASRKKKIRVGSIILVCLFILGGCFYGFLGVMVSALH